MLIVNPAWITAARVERAKREMKVDSLVSEAGLSSREYASAVLNGRVKSEMYADAISKVLDINVQYLIDIKVPNE